MSAASAILPAAPAPPETTPLASVIATDRLISRASRKADRRAERRAFHALTAVLSQDRAAILRCLAAEGLELCGAGTAGISLLESGPAGNIFRWHVLAGALSAFEGGTTPRDWSPCGHCLNAGKPVLYTYPARHFTYFAGVEPEIVEGLVIPIYAEGQAIGTIWIVSHDDARGFDAEDTRIMTSLAKFAGACMSQSVAPTCKEVEPGGRAGQDAVWGTYLRRIARNDHAALTALFQGARPLVFSVALRILSFPADAEEVTADVFARLWSSGNAYDRGRGSATGWIVAITRNLAFDRLRSRAPEVQSPEALFSECSSVADQEGQWMSEERDVLVRKALAGIPVEQRRAIELAYFAELSHSAIADFLGQPLGTIKTRIRLGLIRLRSLLAAVE